VFPDGEAKFPLSNALAGRPSSTVVVGIAVGIIGEIARISGGTPPASFAGITGELQLLKCLYRRSGA
jgi:hypothetical protein